MKRFALIAAISVAACLSLAACESAGTKSATRLVSPVGPETVALAKAAVAHGEKVVDVGDWSRPPEVSFMSGGNAAAAGEIADLLKVNGVTARCIGICGSALAEIVLNSAGCEVTPNGQVIPHLAFVPGGTRAQDKAAALDSARWWLEHDPSPQRADLVTRLERSPDGSVKMRTEDLKAAGCKT